MLFLPTLGQLVLLALPPPSAYHLIMISSSRHPQTGPLSSCNMGHEMSRKRHVAQSSNGGNVTNISNTTYRAQSCRKCVLQALAMPRSHVSYLRSRRIWVANWFKPIANLIVTWVRAQRVLAKPLGHRRGHLSLLWYGQYRTFPFPSNFLYTTIDGRKHRTSPNAT